MCIGSPFKSTHSISPSFYKGKKSSYPRTTNRKSSFSKADLCSGTEKQFVVTSTAHPFLFCLSMFIFLTDKHLGIRSPIVDSKFLEDNFIINAICDY